MKYIDADKLIAEIERRIEEVNIQCQKSRKPQFTLYGKINGFEQILNLVRSLQQEQPEADLDKELDNFITEHDDWDDDNKLARDIARHFFELGLNARKK